MDLQVLTQVGNEFRIHPDQQRQWLQLGGDYGAKLLDSRIFFFSFSSRFSISYRFSSSKSS